MDSTGINETKSELRARLNELDSLIEIIESCMVMNMTARRAVADRRREIEEKLNEASEDLFKSVLQSHKVLCAIKEMDEDTAYGQDPAIYYTLGVCGEAGEMANKIVKALRNGNDPDAARRAVISELPDVIIYSAVLAHVLDIDLTKLVNDKVSVIMDRAKTGYYGGPLIIDKSKEVCEWCGDLVQNGETHGEEKCFSFENDRVTIPTLQS